MDNLSLTEVVIALGTQVIITVASYMKFRSTISKEVSGVKNHTEVSLNKLNGMLSYVIASFDRPAWLKIAHENEDGTIEFRMLDFNEHYYNHYGIPRNSYIGKTDLEAGIDQKLARKFREHDLQVWANDEPSTFDDFIDGERVIHRKFRVKSSTGEAKGVFGYTVNCCPNCPKLNRKNKNESQKRQETNHQG